MNQCPDCGESFRGHPPACPHCGLELFESDPDAEEDEPKPQSHIGVHDLPGWDEFVRESRTKSRDSLRKPKKPVMKQQYGVRWLTGVVFPYNCREDAEAALVPEHGRGAGVLVIRDYEPDTSNATDWREVED